MLIRFILNFLKIICSKSKKFFTLCLSQMKRIGIIVQKVFKLNTSGNSLRYAVFGILIALFVVMYGFPLVFKWSRWFRSGHIASCVEGELYEIEHDVRGNDVVVAHYPKKLTEDYYPLPISGNGYLLVSMLTGEMYIRHRRTLSISTAVGVLYKAEIANAEVTSKESVIMVSVADGYVQTVTCYLGLDHPATIFNKVYAHRKIPQLVVQEITIKNPSSSALNVDVSRINTSSQNGGLDTKTEVFISKKVPVGLPNDKNFSLLYVLQNTVPANRLLVQPHKTENIVVYTLANYSAFSDKPNDLKAQADVVRIALTSQLNSLDNSKTLFNEHSQISRNMYQTGFGISHSKAPNAINGDRVNLTLHYVLAHYQTISLMKPLAKQVAETVMFNADKCYDDHHTLQHSRLWEMPSGTDEYFDFCRRWALTLEKHGCLDLMATGAEGVLTSLVLSFGGFHFTSHHLEFTIHPSELHRDLMHFRGIPYGPHVMVNVSVEMGNDNRAQLFVSVDRIGVAYYACDAGCVDTPVLLGHSPVRIPVKLTKPVMPILYITSDKSHIEELKDVLHYKEIKEAPAHEDDVIALHKHGHQFGGLPTIFWIVIILLIVIFHLFLVKLIVTEYYKSESKFSPPPTYHRVTRFAA